MNAYYNEFDGFADAWLRELQRAGHIAEGTVDERSIKDVRPADLRGFQRVHFFAGIGGWDYALRLAGWPEDREVWTGSCPCQSFSCAGKGAGVNDPRHLWPEMFRLIREFRPATVFGEQVAAAIGHGWLDGVFADLEGEGYACGAAVLPACSVGAPHKRDRIFWGATLAVAHNIGAQEHQEQRGPQVLERKRGPVESCGRGMAGGVVNPASVGQCGGPQNGFGQPPEVLGTGLEWRATEGADGVGIGQDDGWARSEAARTGRTGPTHASDILRPWSRYSVVMCADGKARRIAPEPEIFPLAHGSANRVGILRGSGNAIVPQVAAEFICAFAESV